jgi:hypothetical protein
MSDRYLDEAKLFSDVFANDFSSGWNLVEDELGLIADAFRWYEEKRSSEVCCAWSKNSIGWYSRSCEKGQSFPMPDDGICTSCHRRIKEV